MPKDIDIHRAYINLFNSPDGEIVLNDMKQAHHYNNPSFDPRSPYITSLNEGERNVVLRILTFLEMKPKEE